MKIIIIATGDELVKGLVNDTNSARIARMCEEHGFEIVAHLSVRDNKEELLAALSWSLERADVILTTGGLGPTQDDINREVVAAFVGRDLVHDPQTLEEVKSFFRSRGLPLTENNLTQAAIPRGATIFRNPRGTAPGFAVEKKGTCIVCAPGVPRELIPMVEEQILPFLTKQYSITTSTYTAVLKTFGYTESKVDELLTEALRDHEWTGLRVGLRASFPEVHVIITCSGLDPSRTQEKLLHVKNHVEHKLGDIVFSEDGRSMEAVVGCELRQRGLGLIVAESCTGGLIGDRITNISGSSAYFCGGVIAYSKDLKTALLNVKGATIARSGIVSLDTALEMAKGAYSLAQGPRLALAVTGWMEDPATETGQALQPSTTNFCCALVASDGCWAKGFSLFGDRQQRKLLSSEIGLEMLRRYLKGLALDHWRFPLVTEERHQR